MMQNFNLNQYNRIDAAKQRRIEHTKKRHPAIANGIWLSRDLSNNNTTNNNDKGNDANIFEKSSPIFYGYSTTRRLQKRGPSIPALGREILEKLMLKETGQTKDVYVKVPPYGAGKFVEGRVWDPVNKVHVALDDDNGDVGGKKPGLKGLGRAQNQVCDEYVVHLDWGNDGNGKDLKLANQRKYESGILHVKPDQVQFHVPGRKRMLREEKISRAKEALVSANKLWEKKWQTSPPPDVQGTKMYLAAVFEAVKQYQIGIDFLHGYTVKSKFPARGALKWGEPYASKRKMLLNEIHLNLAICANILGKDNIEKAVSMSIFGCSEVIDKYCKPSDSDDVKLFQAYRDIEKYHRSLKAKLKKSNAAATAAKEEEKSKDDTSTSDDTSKSNNVKKSIKLLQTFVTDLNNLILEKDNGTASINVPPNEELTTMIQDKIIVQHINYISKIAAFKLKRSMNLLQQVDDARLQKALAMVERNDSGDIKKVKGELSNLWAVKGSLLYNEKRVDLLKKLRVNIKERLQRDKKQKMKLGKKLRKANKTGKRFGDDTRGKEARAAEQAAKLQAQQSTAPSPLQNVLPPSFLGGLPPQQNSTNTPSTTIQNTNKKTLRSNDNNNSKNKKSKVPGSKKKKKKKKKKKSDSNDLSFNDYVGYGAIAVGIAALASIVFLKSK